MRISIGTLLGIVLNDTKAFNSIDFDGIYCWRDKGLPKIEKSMEKVRIFSVMKTPLLHVIMYCYPDKKHIGDENLFRYNEKEIITKFLLKTSLEMLKLQNRNFTPLKAMVCLNQIRANSIAKELETDHDYTNPNPDLRAFEEIQDIFLNNWHWLISKKISKNIKSVTHGELLEMLRSIREEVLGSPILKGFKINKEVKSTNYRRGKFIS